MREKKMKSKIDGTSLSPVSVDQEVTVELPRPGSLTAKKDFEIHQNGYDRVIKVGDDLSDVPELFHPNLRTEGVL